MLFGSRNSQRRRGALDSRGRKSKWILLNSENTQTKFVLSNARRIQIGDEEDVIEFCSFTGS